MQLHGIEQAFLLLTYTAPVWGIFTILAAVADFIEWWRS